MKKITPEHWEQILLKTPACPEIILELAFMIAADFKNYAGAVRNGEMPEPTWTDKDLPVVVTRRPRAKDDNKDKNGD